MLEASYIQAVVKWEVGKKQALSMLALLPASGTGERDPLTSSAHHRHAPPFFG